MHPAWWLGAPLLCLAVALSLAGEPVSLGLDRFAFDRLAAWRAQPPTATPVTIVDIDELSLTAAGQWPWPRYRVAAMLAALIPHQPACLGLDIVFAEPDRASPTVIRETYQREFGLDVAVTGLPEGLGDNDAALGEVLLALPSVGAILFYTHLVNLAGDCSPQPLTVGGQTQAISPPQAAGALCNVPPVQNSLAWCGSINLDKDADGVLRRLPLLTAYQGRIYPSFPLAVLMRHLRTSELTVETDFIGPILKIGQTRIPVDNSGRALLRFPPGPGAHPYIPALGLLTGDFDPALVTGRIVLAGSTAEGLNDLHHTPVAAAFPGVEVGAVFLDNALSGSFPRAPRWSRAYAGTAALMIGLSVIWLFSAAGPVKAGLFSLAAALVFPLSSAAVFAASGLTLPLAAPFLTASGLFAALALLLYARERRLAFVRLKKLERVKQHTLESMATVAENRDLEDGGHIKRTQLYARVLAERLAASGNYPFITPAWVDNLYHSAPLHDVGKVSIPDRILLKKARLTPEETAVMRQHVPYGVKIIADAAKSMHGEDFLHLAMEIVRAHHEKWDGSGYPEGLCGRAIPLPARIMAVADVYDALRSIRHYKPSLTHAETAAIITEGRGSHFDPELVDAFFAESEAFERISSSLAAPSYTLEEIR